MMRRLEVVVLDSAQSDLNELFQYVLERTRSRAVPDGFIGDAAEAGRPRVDLFPGLRTWSFERRASIAYVIRNDVVQVTNIFGRGRDVDAFHAQRRSGVRPVR